MNFSLTHHNRWQYMSCNIPSRTVRRPEGFQGGKKKWPQRRRRPRPLVKHLQRRLRKSRRSAQLSAPRRPARRLRRKQPKQPPPRRRKLPSVASVAPRRWLPEITAGRAANSQSPRDPFGEVPGLSVRSKTTRGKHSARTSPRPEPRWAARGGTSMQAPHRVFAANGARRRKHACSNVARVLSCFCWMA